MSINMSAFVAPIYVVERVMPRTAMVDNALGIRVFAVISDDISKPTIELRVLAHPGAHRRFHSYEGSNGLPYLHEPNQRPR